jgi:hypothetical protein
MMDAIIELESKKSLELLYLKSEKYIHSRVIYFKINQDTCSHPVSTERDDILYSPQQAVAF